MGWDGKLFQKKIEYLLEILCDSDIDKLADYFCQIGTDDKKYRSRKNLIRDIWLLQPLKSPLRIITKQNFKNFNIAKLNIDGNKLFSYDSFFTESLDDFKKKVDSFNQSKFQESNFYEMEYRYIYYFAKALNKVVYFKFENIQNIGDKEFSFKAIPKHSSVHSVGDLSAKIKIEDNLITINAHNKHEKVTLYFSYNFKEEKNNLLYGVGISKMYNIEPRASKALLSKKKLSIDEKIIFYLNSSESEYLTSHEENEKKTIVLKESFYLNKYYKKIESVYTFLRKTKWLFRGRLASNIYLNIFFKEFKTFIAIYQKVLDGKKYFVESRKRATAVFLKSMVARESSCYIVHPLFDKISNFIADNDRAIASVDLNIKVAQKGVKINRIFVIESVDELDSFGIASIKRMLDVGIGIKFVFREDIETKVSSYDFAFPIEKDIVLHKERSSKVSDLYSVNLDKTTIIMYANLYREIEKRSYGLEKILELKEQNTYEEYIPKENFLFSQNNVILQKLLKDDGLWYFYSYPSNQNIEEKVWIIETQFYENFTLIDSYRNRGQFFIGTHQTIVIKEGENSKNMTTIVFDNSKIAYDILPFARISKSNRIEEQIFNFGFFSRKEFSEDEATEILGDIEKVQLKIDYSFVQRVHL